ncbi:Lectin-domain containing receptor kinase VI.3 [Senna tora]|uniref:non-specific serine/threonine protein kinase n=1 Tax=Senna tora TaxID=362788 RepID=A0A834XK33_9FABA|nr:Lectin-domain containing receptor kinase VI.3 [Senna tora]
MASSSSKLGFLLLLLFLSLLVASKAQQESHFVFNGFNNTGESDLILQGATIIKSNGLLKLTNKTYNTKGQAFHSKLFQFQKLNTSTKQQEASSFSTTFVFSIVPSSSGSGGFGLAFAITPKTNLSDAEPGHFLGLFNNFTDGNPSNHILAVEFDTVNGFRGESDTEGNHIGVNINGMQSKFSEPAAYIEEGTEAQKEEFNMEKSNAVQAWIDYDGDKKVLNVTIAPFPLKKPSKPLISEFIDLKDVLRENMYIGFSAATGNIKASSHYILGWSFSMNGSAPPLNNSLLPAAPSKESDSVSSSFPWVKFAIVFLSALTLILLFSMCFLTLYKRYTRFETLEDWELDCPHRFKYRDLHIATKGFKESELIGVGGFGAVYKGVLPSSGTEVAVKKIFRSPVQGMREFAAEIESLGRLRHKNLVNLQGWWTIGYIAPELIRTGKASTSSDVYAYGVLLLEVATARRPIGSDHFFLVDWIVENYNLGQILEVIDPKLNSVYVEEEVELVLKLGLLCAQHNADSRPTMRQVTRYLNFDYPLPEIGDWRRHSESESGIVSFGFSEMVSTSTFSTTSCNISSNISMNSRSSDVSCVLNYSGDDAASAYLYWMSMAE